MYPCTHVPMYPCTRAPAYAVAPEVTNRSHCAARNHLGQRMRALGPHPPADLSFEDTSLHSEAVGRGFHSGAFLVHMSAPGTLIRLTLAAQVAIGTPPQLTGP